jgi:hypothetical protein
VLFPLNEQHLSAQMKTQQPRTHNWGSGELTEELGGFCNKPLHSVGLKYRPATHSREQYFRLTFYSAFCACLKAGSSLYKRVKGQSLGLQRPGLEFWSCHLTAEGKGSLQNHQSPLCPNYHICKGSHQGHIRVCILPCVHTVR